MIILENVNKYFNKGKKNSIHVINNTSLALEDSGLVALLGPSGCGKTTLLNAIGGLDNINKGKIFINGKKITSHLSYKKDKIRNLNIGYIFQDYNLIDNMTVFDNVALSLKINGIKDKEEIKNRVNHILESVGMYRYRNRFANMLSGGERQRVGIARAIVKNPSIIIADEPTGNLDSKNSIAIMNIIKSISKEKLVILVTHEKDLASFYATRIIDIKDGSIINDYLNDHNLDLDYKMDSKIYLKDFIFNKEIKSDNLKINYYSNEEKEIELNIVCNNGNIYIETKSKEKIEAIDDTSNIELINDNYKKISKNSYENEINFSSMTSDTKMKYSSIYNIFSLITNGFKKMINYSFIKKVLLIGFLVSGMFITYSVSSIMGVSEIKDENFIQLNKGYLELKKAEFKIDDYLMYEDIDSIKYIIPGDSIVSFKINFKEYYQTSGYSLDLNGSLSSIELIEENMLIKGRMPSNNLEIIVDKLTIENLINNNRETKNVGLVNYDDILGKDILITNMAPFKVVGIVDLNSPSIYTYESNFINIVYNSKSGLDFNEYENQTYNYMDYSLSNDIIITSGRAPVNDYEVILNQEYKEEYEINKTYNEIINGIKLKVVGFYHSQVDTYTKFVSTNTIKHDLISKQNKIMIYPNNKEETINYFRSLNLNVVDKYMEAKDDYKKNRYQEVISILVFSSIILIISLVEIFLIIRSSFLSRIKEVGIMRAIGVKKTDIYKMFLGEILAITTIASMLGSIFMYYSLSQLVTISIFKDLYMVNTKILLISIIIIYIFNIVIGLFPVFNTLRKTPAQILSRTDLE